MCQQETKRSATSVSSFASPSRGEKSGTDLAQCVIFHVVFGNDAKTPGSLRQHLKKSHTPNFNARNAWSWTLMEPFIRKRRNWWQRLTSCCYSLPKEKKLPTLDRHLPNRTCWVLRILRFVPKAIERYQEHSPMITRKASDWRPCRR